MSKKGSTKRGKIYVVDLEPTKGAEKGKSRYGVVISNDFGNKLRHNPIVLIAPLTSKVTDKRKKMPMHVHLIPNSDNCLKSESLVDLMQIRVLDIDERLGDYVGQIREEKMKKIDKALSFVLQLSTCPKCDSPLFPNKKHCVNCKYVLVDVCKNCHNEIKNNYNFCPHCGNERGSVNG